MGATEQRHLSRALVVDDDQVLRLLEQETLSQFGFEVCQAADGETALALLVELPPDLVLLDVDMPGIDGFEVCRCIRQRWDANDVPVIMVTGMDDLNSINQAYESGASDFIAKPIHWPILGYRARYVLRSAQAAQQLRELEERQSAIVRAMPDIIFLANRAGVVLDYKEGYGTTAFVPPVRLLGSRLSEVLPADVGRLIVHALRRSLATGDLQEAVCRLMQNDGVHHYEVRIAPSGTDKAVIVVRDITSQRINEERIRRLAYFDTLTGIPNRQSFLERLDRELLRARGEKRQVALLFVDLDGFKQINDTLGHAAGDYLLQAVAERLKEKLRGSDFVARPLREESGLHVARLGGDEFAVVLPDLDSTQVVTRIAERMQSLISQPFQIGQHEVTVSSSIGVALFPDDGDDSASLLKHADSAMYQAKARGRNNWQRHVRTPDGETAPEFDLASEFGHALQRDELRLVYQPQVLADDGTITGVEALLRWQHPQHGLISPNDFLPVAEQSGLIVAIGEWVIRHACRQLKTWLRDGVMVPRVAVNVSARQLWMRDFAACVTAIIAETGIEPNQLELEISERLLTNPDAGRVDGLERLQQLGVRLSVDDFGSGYSSLSHVKRWPTGVLKIDQSLVHGLPHHRRDAGIATAIIALARSLGLEVVAEGVETVAQADFLHRANCGKLQGYLFSRPLPAEDVERLLRQGRIALPARRSEAGCRQRGKTVG
ncbi:EAL domain-containing protein [Accumulibacter sp.]|uniref:putative bifunctional diguanylate cyclase/phosphodiesterase n=1 Tax=Accumulibacter sp. TaxID=2053492 RepID=UPI0026179728|nr:EAL domain-containing protein [Accumulibacter sp.]